MMTHVFKYIALCTALLLFGCSNEKSETSSIISRSHLTFISDSGDEDVYEMPMVKEVSSGMFDEIFSGKSGTFIWVLNFVEKGGTAEYTGTLKNGRLDGRLQGHYINDGTRTLISDVSYIDDVKNGPSLACFPQDGSAQYKAAFNEGKLDGIVEMFYLNGQKAALLNYKEGVLNGDQKIYDAEGNLLLECRYIDGKPMDGSFLYDLGHFMRSYAQGSHVDYDVIYFVEGEPVARDTVSLNNN